MSKMSSTEPKQCMLIELTQENNRRFEATMYGSREEALERLVELAGTEKARETGKFARCLWQRRCHYYFCWIVEAENDGSFKWDCDEETLDGMPEFSDSESV